MGSKPDEESDISDSEIDECKEAAYKMLKFRTFKIRAPDGKFRCLFCEDKEVCQYTPLLQHAVKVAESKNGAKRRALHSAVARYLETELADWAEPPPKSSQPSEPRNASEVSFDGCLISKERESNEKLQEAKNAVIEEISSKSDDRCSRATKQELYKKENYTRQPIKTTMADEGPEWREITPDDSMIFKDLREIQKTVQNYGNRYNNVQAQVHQNQTQMETMVKYQKETLEILHDIQDRVKNLHSSLFG